MYDHSADKKSNSCSCSSTAQSLPVQQRLAIEDRRPATVLQAQLQRKADHFAQQQALPLQKMANTTGLPDGLKNGMEQVSQISLDHVKVHYNSSKPASIQAHAYTQGSEIHVGPGQEKHLPHELGHVVQQAQGRVKSNASIGGVPLNTETNLEQEATQLGDKASSITQRQAR